MFGSSPGSLALACFAALITEASTPRSLLSNAVAVSHISGPNGDEAPEAASRSSTATHATGSEVSATSTRAAAEEHAAPESAAMIVHDDDAIDREPVTEVATDAVHDPVVHSRPPPSTPSARVPPVATTEATQRTARLAKQQRQILLHPPIERVQRGALARASLGKQTARTLRAWRRRARAAAALPQVTSTMTWDADRGWDLDQEAGVADRLGRDLGQGRTLQVRAQWSLDELVFNLDELRAVRSTLDVLDWQERLLLDVTRLYFERVRLCLASAEVTDPAAQLERRTRIKELEAVLHGLTGVSFADAEAARSCAGARD